MTNYEALIKAVLDTSGVEKSIDSLQNKTVTLNLDIKTGNTSIDSFLKSIESQMKTSGQNAGSNFSDAMNSGIKKSLSGGANAIKQEQKEIANAFKDMKDIARKIGSVEKELFKSDAGGKTQSFETAKQQLQELEKEYDNLKAKFGQKLSDRQNSELDAIFKNNLNSLTQLDAKLSDTSAIQQRKSAMQEMMSSQKNTFQELLSLQQQIKSTSVDLIKAEATGSTKSAEDLRAKLEELLKTYQELYNASKSSLDSSQIQALGTAVNQTEERVRSLRNALSDKMSLNISTADMKSQIDGLKGSFETLTQSAKNLKLDVNTDSIVADLKELDEIQKKIASEDTSIEQKYAAYERYDEVIKRVSTSMKGFEKDIDSAVKANEKIQQTMLKSDTLSSKMTSWMNENKKAAQAYGQEIANLQAKLKQNPGDAKVYQEVAAQFQNIQARAKAAGMTVGDFGNKIASTAKQLLGLTSAFAVFQKVKQIFSEMYHAVYDIDTAMTNLYKVTDETGAKYSQFLQNAKKDAQELGRTVSDIIEQTATWAKLGYNIDDARNLSKISSVYANVGEISNETAVSDMVTAMKAFKIEAKDAVTIVDPLNELGNRFATSAGSLGAGLSKSASTLHLAGASMNETLAMLTGASEITQNAQEFGNALKVGAMRVLHTSIAPVFGDRYRKPCELLKNLA